MSIVSMKRLSVIALEADRDLLLQELMKLGCVEVSPLDAELSEPEWASLTSPDESGASRVSAKINEIRDALSVLAKYAPVKKGLFSPRRAVPVERFFDVRKIDQANEKALSINNIVREIAAYRTEISRLESRKISLMPWRLSDVPLDTDSTPSMSVAFGVCPGTIPFDEVEDSVRSVSEAFKLELYHSDPVQHYFLLICHADDSESVFRQLKSLGFSPADFKGFRGTAEENIRLIEARVNKIEGLIGEAEKRLASFRPDIELLENAADALSAELAREDTRQKLLRTEHAVFFKGWVPQREMKRVETLLAKLGCAYMFSDPAEGDSPPVCLHNSRFIYPFTMVTELYSLPEYGTIDPNPLMAFFFALFFGIMYADIGYGLVLLTISIIAMKKFNLRRGSTSEQLFMLAGICGVASVICGVLFGSFFGDAVGVFTEVFLGRRVDLPPLAFNPLTGNGPLMLLVASLALGAIHILFGMAIKAYSLIRDGKPWDALMDVGSWWLVFAGLAVLALGHGYYVFIAGLLAVVLTQGRHSTKGFFGKLISGLGKLYDITGYLSDVLSYSRLMALCMASAVIASVFNILSGLTGPILFWPVFLIGHAFNMGINIIGTFVHDARLQYLEFFSKWYAEGGKPFEPLRILTKYVDVANVDVAKSKQEENAL